ncbi:MAG TPA: tetratricopeptide repeat protein [Pyrinomonadaceae bacterium]|jgi:tetratricopeptide (TPR) repeat protein
MTKENILFGIIGLLLGCIVGFIGANSLNQNYGAGQKATAQPVAGQGAGLPADHPPVSQSNGVADQPGMQEVQEQIQKARNEPNNFDAQMSAAVLFYRIGRYDEAIEYLMKANQLRPDDYQTLVRLGDANFEAEHYKEAEGWYAAAVAKNPNDVNALTDLGTTFMARQPPDFDRAIKEYSRSLAINPKHEQTLHNMVIAYTKKGDAVKAQEMLNLLLEVNPNNEDLPRLRADLETLRSGGQQTPTSAR